MVVGPGQHPTSSERFLYFEGGCTDSVHYLERDEVNDNGALRQVDVIPAQIASL
jgi:hypothetical protein